MDRERRAVEQAVRAGDAAAKSSPPCGFLHLEHIMYMIRFYCE